ncbi:hypothetical protein F511_10685 [Dorcoceras hygrometricum]|uniref:Uncharacterized protein n=1 Tax=Dorcoceras hygrometricum TaxID=472368 RepID=A0A2Z7CH40_9LAMI|nr:hypothetical protein F511_10685 [Dorcoceras hygrometricum]
MACVQYLHLFILFLVSLVCSEIQLTEGRQLKDLKKNESGANKNHEGLQPHASKPMINKQIPERKNYNQIVTEQRQTIPPMTHSNEFGSSDISHSNDFRPTQPGNSPGVGHSFTGRKDSVQAEVKSHESGVTHTVEGSTDDFRPTGPGHSPGVGHYYQNMNK